MLHMTEIIIGPHKYLLDEVDRVVIAEGEDHAQALIVLKADIAAAIGQPVTIQDGTKQTRFVGQVCEVRRPKAGQCEVLCEGKPIMRNKSDRLEPQTKPLKLVPKKQRRK